LVHQLFIIHSFAPSPDDVLAMSTIFLHDMDKDIKAELLKTLINEYEYTQDTETNTVKLGAVDYPLVTIFY
jgi:hypothetical protein